MTTGLWHLSESEISSSKLSYTQLYAAQKHIRGKRRGAAAGASETPTTIQRPKRPLAVTRRPKNSMQIHLHRAQHSWPAAAVRRVQNDPFYRQFKRSNVTARPCSLTPHITCFERGSQRTHQFIYISVYGSELYLIDVRLLTHARTHTHVDRIDRYVSLSLSHFH